MQNSVCECGMNIEKQSRFIINDKDQCKNCFIKNVNDINRLNNTKKCDWCGDTIQKKTIYKVNEINFCGSDCLIRYQQIRENIKN